MTLQEALQQQLETVTPANQDWEYFEWNGISYKTETVLSNSHNASKLEQKASIENVGDEFMREEIIRLENGDPLLPVNIDGGLDLMGNGGGSFRENGLLLA